MYVHTKICTHVHSTLFTTVQNYKPKCLPTNEWINKMWYIHIMEYFSAIKRKVGLLHDTTWINFEYIIVSGRNYTKSDQKGHIFYLDEMLELSKPTETTPVFLPGESRGWWSLVGFRLWGHTESDTTEAT